MTTTNTQGAAIDRENFIRWHMAYLHTDEMLAAHVWDNDHIISQAWRAALASAAVPAQQPEEAEATHLRELAAYRLTVENLEREIAQQPAPSPAPAVHSRHPVVVRWRNDGIEACAGIAEYYGCTAAARDMRVMLTAAPTAQADTQPAPVPQVNYSVLYLYAERKRVDYNDLCATVHEAIDRAARAPADSVLEDAARLTSEQEHAIRQGHEIATSDRYFEARPQIDSNDRRNVFQAGFERGWDAARKQGEKQ
jgi:hypothetical protein